MFKLSWKNFKHYQSSFLPAILVLAMGVALINLVLYLKDSFDKNLKDNAKGIDLVIGAKGSPMQLVLANVYHIDNPTGNIKIRDFKDLIKNPSIEKAIPLSYGDNHKGFRLLGTTYSFIKHYGASLESGSYFSEPLDVVIGSHVAQKLGLSIGDTFHSTHGHGHNGHSHDDTNYKIVGILKQTNKIIDNLLLTPLASVWKTHGKQDLKNDWDEESYAELNGTLDALLEKRKAQFLADTTRTRRKKSSKKEITALLISFKKDASAGFMLQGQINRYTPMMAASPPIEINKLFNMLGFGLDTLIKVAYLIIIISILTLSLTLIRLFHHRKYELSLLRVFGSGKSQLSLLLFLEVIWVIIFGFVIGFIISKIGIFLAQQQITSDFQHQLQFSFFGRNELIILGICFITGMVSVLIPLIRTYRIDISKTLASE